MRVELPARSGRTPGPSTALALLQFLLTGSTTGLSGWIAPTWQPLKERTVSPVLYNMMRASGDASHINA